MKTGEAAKALGVDRTTVKDWISNRGFKAFFSPEATGESGGRQRDITEADFITLNTIRCCLNSRQMKWHEISNYLQTGQRDHELPQGALASDMRTVPIQQAEQSAKALKTVAERDLALQRIGQLEMLVATLSEKLEDSYRQRREETAAHATETADLKVALAKAQTELDLYRAGRIQPE